MASSLATLSIKFYFLLLHIKFASFAASGATKNIAGYATTKAFEYSTIQICTKPSIKPKCKYVIAKEMINAIIADIIKVKTYL